MNEHVKKGNISEQQFILYCLKNNINISRPIFNDLRYDFIIEYNNQLLRVQVKTAYKGNTKENRFMFDTSNTVCTMSETRKKDYINDIDLFAVYCEAFLGANHPFIFVPVEKATTKSMIMYFGDNKTDTRLNRCFNYYQI